MKKFLIASIFAILLSMQFSFGQNLFNGHKYVDLGLPSGTLWATSNVGAGDEEQFGSEFAWGEISSKSEFSDKNYHFIQRLEDNKYRFTKYTEFRMKSFYSRGDGRSVLEKEDDAASVNWGDGWRMPTKEEFQELIDNCTYEIENNTYEIKNGEIKNTGGKRSGLLLTSKINGNKLFFPVNREQGVGDDGLYWSASLDIAYGGTNAWRVRVVADKFYERKHFDLETRSRYFGGAIRPVCSKTATSATISKEPASSIQTPSNDLAGWENIGSVDLYDGWNRKACSSPLYIKSIGGKMFYKVIINGKECAVVQNGNYHHQNSNVQQYRYRAGESLFLNLPF